ncbi:glycosyltransferase [Staphylococcus sp. IVB6238]|uniref:glycosyltransferase n=1 Tax=Staphylococcus sp. IVB6238 TaxID=2989770 RepID=UPI0021CFDB9D|nr:glycosyltransferase [Staphylococcus sp. IVB6238]UXR73144.1 glycosyltransferase [Staphylococcus sp. IVB6238]
MNTIFLTSRLDRDHGGLTASLLNKARILYDYKGLKSKILTFHADHNFNDVKNEIVKRYDLENKTDILNINDYYRERGLQNSPVRYTLDTSELSSVNLKGNVKEFYNNGVKVLEITYDNNSIKEAKYFTENNLCIKKDVIDKDGYLYWTTHYLNKNLSRQVFYRKDGTAFQAREYDATNNKKNIKNVVLFDETITRFNSFDAFKRHFVEEFITDICNYLVGEARAQDSVILSIKDSRVRKIFMTHSIHIRPGTDIVRAGNRKVLYNLNEVDALVLLTEKQKADVINRFGERTNYFVLPHSIEIPENTQTRDHNKIVMIARLHEEKRLEHAIQAFKKVSKEKPKAQLLIYGDGDQKENLQKLIDKLQLKENVKLMGYANNIDEILQSATCSLITSKYEGFPLAIQESIANGTPVIAYDIRYGPSAMIDHGKNGYLVEEGNINKLASTIIKYLSGSKNERKKFSENSIAKAKTFSDERFAISWINLFEKLKSPKVEVTPNVKLIKLEKKLMPKNTFKIQVEVKVNDHRKHIKPQFWGTFYNRSTIKSDGTRKHKKVNAVVKERKDDLYKLEFLFKSNEFEINEVYDVFLTMQYDTYYFELRVGNDRNPVKVETLKTKKAKPYFTKPHDNLSFKL